MKIKNDDVLVHLRSFGFTNEEHTVEGFRRYTKRIGNLLITIANGQFEKRIRISLLQDKEGHIRTGYKDIVAYSELVCAMQEAGILDACMYPSDMYESANQEPRPKIADECLDNPLCAFPRKPDGFMAQ